MKEFDELTITDNFLFQKVMQNEEICKIFLEKILRKKILKLNYMSSEKTIDVDLKSKSVRLDIYVETDEGILIDVEMQAADRKKELLPKRARFYEAMMDLNNLYKGNTYADLKESYVIFICAFDPFELNRKIYTFHNVCKEDNNLRLNDGTAKIFLNTKGTVGEIDDEIDEFLAYADGKNTEGNFVAKIKTEVEKVKNREETRLDYMTLLMALREERNEGYKEGCDKSAINFIKSLTETQNISVDAAMEALKIPIEERENYRNVILKK